MFIRHRVPAGARRRAEAKPLFRLHPVPGRWELGAGRSPSRSVPLTQRWQSCRIIAWCPEPRAKGSPAAPLLQRRPFRCHCRRINAGKLGPLE